MEEIAKDQRGMKMFDKDIFYDALAAYKRDFVSMEWKREKYKWVAVKHFQDSWDINATDFAAMLKESFSKTYNLLSSMNNFPAGVLQDFAEAAPDELRKMFIALYDESSDVYERISTFKKQSAIMLEKYGHGAANHYQSENSISVYLWLRYPEKYYIFKFGEVKKAATELKSNYRFKKGAYAENIRNFFQFYDELCAAISEDSELTDLLKSQLTDACYPDPEYKTLTTDFGFYVSRYYSDRDKAKTPAPDMSGWFPADYNPGFSANDWMDLISDKTIFTASSLEIMKRMLDYGGQATCKQLSVKYGESANFYNSGSQALARRIIEKTHCPLLTENNENSKYWPILYVGQRAGKDTEGTYIWRLRDELKEALQNINLSKVNLYANSDTGDDQKGYWWLNANPKIWSFSKVQVGDVQDYTLYNDNGNKRRIFQNFVDAKTGDLVIGYESNPVKQVVALAKVSAANDGEKIFFEKTEGLSTPIDYLTLKACPELEKMEFFQNPNGSFFKLTKGEYEFIMDMIRDENPLQANEVNPTYTKEDFLAKVYMTEEKYNRLAGVLLNKKNIILQGAPGVGKTFAARRLAYSLMGEEDDSRIEFVQFHQNYSYEDFMMGYKPSGDGFELKYGVFYKFCQKAANHLDQKYFFIIDEINRGNLSKIFGELLMLIESDYRGTEVTLAYNGMPFTVPENLYIIGMMNTADRSLAMIDYALRRRFSFFAINPAFESKGFGEYQASLHNETFNELIEQIVALNVEISRDKSLGNGFCIGHSYFCGQTEETCTDEWMQAVVDYDILPMLSEYWFDDETKVTRWDNLLHGVFQ